ncbi:hypothetical protein FRC07_001048 [Ceratobasidium sp. 392]|nr:hypothetical protein FRC07_001048 [Ceratobasidium sp. 392]
MAPPSSSNQPPRNRTRPTPGASSSKQPSAQLRSTPSPKISSGPKSGNSVPSGPSSSSGPSTSRQEQNAAPPRPESELVHPFAQSNGLVQIIKPTVNDLIEEEARFWDEFTTDDGTRSAANTSGRISPPGSVANRSVFSNDIWMDDNSGNADRTFARDVQLVGWASVGDNISTGYVVYDCAIRTKEGVTIHLHKRYNSFVKLNDALRRTLPSDVVHNIPALPPKNALDSQPNTDQHSSTRDDANSKPGLRPY